MISTICDYIKSEKEDVYLLPYLEGELEKLENYQNSLKVKIEEQKKQNMRIHKINEYKTIWGKKGLLYKLIHRDLNPDNNNFSEMLYEDVVHMVDIINTSKKL